MAEIVKVPMKELTRFKYAELTLEELDITEGTLIQEANSAQDVEYTFAKWGEDKNGKFAICYTPSNVDRYFFADAIKKSSKQILREKTQERKIAKAQKNRLKSEKEQIKLQKKLAKEEAERIKALKKKKREAKKKAPLKKKAIKKQIKKK